MTQVHDPAVLGDRLSSVQDCVRDSSGNLIVYYGGSGSQQTAISTDDGSTWQTAAVGSNQPESDTGSGSTSMAIDSTDTCHGVYKNDGSLEAYYTQYTQATDGTATTTVTDELIHTGDNAIHATAVAVDSNDEPVALVVDESKIMGTDYRHIYIYQRRGGTWTQLVSLTGQESYFNPSPVIDSNDVLHYAHDVGNLSGSTHVGEYDLATDTDNGSVQANGRTCNGSLIQDDSGMWAVTSEYFFFPKDPSWGNGTSFTDSAPIASAATYAGGEYHIVYQTDGSGPHGTANDILHISSPDAGSWDKSTTTVIASSANSLESPTSIHIAGDTRGTVDIVYSDTTAGALHYESVETSTTVVETTTGTVATGTAATTTTAETITQSPVTETDPGTVTASSAAPSTSATPTTTATSTGTVATGTAATATTVGASAATTTAALPAAVGTETVGVDVGVATPTGTVATGTAVTTTTAETTTHPPVPETDAGVVTASVATTLSTSVPAGGWGGAWGAIEWGGSATESDIETTSATETPTGTVGTAAPFTSVEDPTYSTITVTDAGALATGAASTPSAATTGVVTPTPTTTASVGTETASVDTGVATPTSTIATGAASTADAVEAGAGTAPASLAPAAGTETTGAEASSASASGVTAASVAATTTTAGTTAAYSAVVVTGAVATTTSPSESAAASTTPAATPGTATPTAGLSTAAGTPTATVAAGVGTVTPADGAPGQSTTASPAVGVAGTLTASATTTTDDVATVTGSAADAPLAVTTTSATTTSTTAVAAAAATMATATTENTDHDTGGVAAAAGGVTTATQTTLGTPGVSPQHGTVGVTTTTDGGSAVASPSLAGPVASPFTPTTAGAATTTSATATTGSLSLTAADVGRNFETTTATVTATSATAQGGAATGVALPATSPVGSATVGTTADGFTSERVVAWTTPATATALSPVSAVPGPTDFNHVITATGTLGGSYEALTGVATTAAPLSGEALVYTPELATATVHRGRTLGGSVITTESATGEWIAPVAAVAGDTHGPQTLVGIAVTAEPTAGEVLTTLSLTGVADAVLDVLAGEVETTDETATASAVTAFDTVGAAVVERPVVAEAFMTHGVLGERQSGVVTADGSRPGDVLVTAAAVTAARVAGEIRTVAATN